MMINNNCLVCRLAKGNRIFKCNTFELFRCRYCNNTYLISDKRQTYEEEYYTDRQAYYRNYKKDYNEEEYPIPIYKNIIENIKKLGYRNGKLLEIGCSKGLFLELADKAGFSVCGLDISQYAIDYVRDNFNLSAICSDIIGAKLLDNSFDIVAMIDVIEHVDNPVEIIRESYRILKPGGVIVIDTPNEDSLINSISFSMYRLSLFQIKFLVRTNHEVEHLVYFSPLGIKKVLNDCSFELLKLELFNIDPSVRGLNGIINLCTRAVFCIADILGRQNKMVVFAKKENREVSEYDKKVKTKHSFI